MTSKIIYTATDRSPYTYLIGWTNHNKWYYGRRTAKGCNPAEFWLTYFTSSKYVKEFRQKYGNPDLIKIRKVFNNTEECVNWEHRFLSKVNAAQNDDFLNQTNGDLKWDTTNKINSEESNIKRGLFHKGKPKPVSQRLKISLSQKGMKKPRTAAGVKSREKFLESLSTDEKKELFGKHMLNISPEQRLSISKNSSKHDYELTNTEGQKFNHWSLNSFAAEHNLSFSMLYRNVNKGVIKTTTKRYNRMSQTSINTLGWSIKILDQATATATGLLVS